MAKGPTFLLEKAFTSGPVCGVDEAGRGPWAGPVSAGAVILDPRRTPKGLDDSKKLTAKARERLEVEIKAHPKSFDLLDLHGPVTVEGKIRAPRTSISRSFPIPTPVFGRAKTLDCAGLTQQLFSAP